MLNDDDWELFVPAKGGMYPNQYQVKLHDSSDWQDGGSPGLTVKSPTCYAYRKPKQKENKIPDRTPQQALKDAIDSGAVDAWINEEEIEVRALGSTTWHTVTTAFMFTDPLYEYQPKPPEPTKINWRPVVKGKEPQGLVLGVWYGTVATCTYAPEDGWRLSNDGSVSAAPKFYAPMCNLPEGDK